MDIAGKDSIVVPQEKINESVTYHSPNIHSDWLRVDENLTNTSMEMVAVGSTVMESSTCSSAPVVDSVGPHIWDHRFNAQNLGYCDMNVQYNGGTSSSLDPVRSAILKGGMFQPSFPTMLPQSFPHLPSDSAFIERAARFSCFGGGSFGQMMNPFVLGNPPLNPCVVMQGPPEVLGGNSVKPLPGISSQRCGINVTTQIFEEGMFREAGEGIPQKKSGSFVASFDEAKQPIGVSGSESDESEFSGHGTREELGTPPGKSSLKVLGSKKRKRSGQENEQDDNHETPQLSVETVKENEEIRQNDDQNPATTVKIGGKNAKQGSQGTDPIKDGYVHIRARRGQATNSHSLAERVRREKISERMKFLQDLVPGCSKVTGKAVMLDEIINYVQSLQRQVEFLSMKLATVNPRLDFNSEGFVTKDQQMLQPRPGMPSSLVFPPDMTPFRPLHPSQHGALQTALPAPDVWEDELHNIIHMGFNSNAPNSQDLSCSLPPGRMKQEP